MRLRSCLGGSRWRFATPLPPDDGLRPSFLGHILVELLLDAALIEEDPPALNAYYAALDQVEPSVVQAAVNRVANRPTGGLAGLIEMFCTHRFLFDYASDEKLLFRLNQVMQRVKLPPLDSGFARLLPSARAAVGARRDELLAIEPPESN